MAGMASVPKEVLDTIIKSAYTHTDPLTLSLVSSGFEDSVNATQFQHEISTTIFDIRSPQSMQRLEEISKDPLLNRAVTSLQFTCYDSYALLNARFLIEEDGKATREGDFESVMTGATFDKWQKLKEGIESWYPGAWKNREQLEGESYGDYLAEELQVLVAENGLYASTAHVMDKHGPNGLIEFVGNCLSRFPRLDRVAFYGSMDTQLVWD